jgi:hypothetical protein
MASVFMWIIVGLFGCAILFAIPGVIIFIRNRLHRESEGDIFLMKRDTEAGSPPIELRAQRDYRYKDAGVDPYKDE